MASTFTMKAGDTSPILEEILLNPDGTSVQLAGAAVRLNAFNPYGEIVINETVTIVDATAGEVSYEFDGTLAAGTYQYEFIVTYADSSIETFPNEGFNNLVINP